MDIFKSAVEAHENDRKKTRVGADSIANNVKLAQMLLKSKLCVQQLATEANDKTMDLLKEIGVLRRTITEILMSCDIYIAEIKRKQKAGHTVSVHQTVMKALSFLLSIIHGEKKRAVEVRKLQKQRIIIMQHTNMLKVACSYNLKAFENAFMQTRKRKVDPCHFISDVSDETTMFSDDLVEMLNFDTMHAIIMKENKESNEKTMEAIKLRTDYITPAQDRLFITSKVNEKESVLTHDDMKRGMQTFAKVRTSLTNMNSTLETLATNFSQTNKTSNVYFQCFVDEIQSYIARHKVDHDITLF